MLGLLGVRVCSSKPEASLPPMDSPVSLFDSPLSSALPVLFTVVSSLQNCGESVLPIVGSFAELFTLIILRWVLSCYICGMR